MSMNTAFFNPDAENVAPEHKAKATNLAGKNAAAPVQRRALGNLTNQQPTRGLAHQTQKPTQTTTRSQMTTLQPSPQIRSAVRVPSIIPMSPATRQMEDDDTAESGAMVDDELDAELDVDSKDKHDAQACVEYIPDIMQHFFKVEARKMANPQYMRKQGDINAKMREILVDWLVEVHQRFKLRPEVLYLTINLVDRFLERKAVKRDRLQLVGCTAMLLASKYEEIYPPEVRDFVYISDNAYTKEQILVMEQLMLNTLKFSLTVPSALRFGQRFTKVAGSTGKDLMGNYVLYMCELTLQDYSFLRYVPSMIAASATYLASYFTEQPQVWTPALRHHTTYSVETLQPCIKALYELVARPPLQIRYKAVRKKYASSKFAGVSTLQVPVTPRLALQDPEIDTEL